MNCQLRVEVSNKLELTIREKYSELHEYVQIFQKVIAHIQTGITIESMLDQFTRRIDQIQSFSQRIPAEKLIKDKVTSNCFDTTSRNFSDEDVS